MSSEIVGTMRWTYENEGYPFVMGSLEVSYGVHDLVLENYGLPFEIERVFLSVEQEGEQVCGGSQQPSVYGYAVDNSIVIHAVITANTATIGFIGVGL